MMASPPPSPGDLPRGWSSSVTDEGITYYHNDHTQHTQWEKPTLPAPPEGWSVHPHGDTLKHYWQHDAAGGATQWHHPGDDSDEDHDEDDSGEEESDEDSDEDSGENEDGGVPGGPVEGGSSSEWVQRHSAEHDAHYWQHTLTGEKTWVCPPELNLPRGWSSGVSSSSRQGATYYHNDHTQHTQWENPTLPAPPEGWSVHSHGDTHFWQHDAADGAAQWHHPHDSDDSTLRVGDRVEATKEFHHAKDKSKSGITIGMRGFVKTVDSDGDYNILWDPDKRQHWAFAVKDEVKLVARAADVLSAPTSVTAAASGKKVTAKCAAVPEAAKYKWLIVGNTKWSYEGSKLAVNVTCASGSYRFRARAISASGVEGILSDESVAVTVGPPASLASATSVAVTALRVAGHTGKQNTLMSVYLRNDEHSPKSGVNVFTKMGSTDNHCFLSSAGTWIIGSTAAMLEAKNTGLVASSTKSPSPLGLSWNFAEDGSFHVDPLLKVTEMSTRDVAEVRRCLAITTLRVEGRLEKHIDLMGTYKRNDQCSPKRGANVYTLRRRGKSDVHCFASNNGKWLISDTEDMIAGKITCWIMSATESLTPLGLAWKYGDGGFHLDPLLKVTEGSDGRGTILLGGGVIHEEEDGVVLVGDLIKDFEEKKEGAEETKGTAEQSGSIASELGLTELFENQRERVGNAILVAARSAEVTVTVTRMEMKHYYSYVVVEMEGKCCCFSCAQEKLDIVVGYAQIIGFYTSRLTGGAWFALAPVFGTVYNFIAVDFVAIVQMIGDDVLTQVASVFAAIASVAVFIVGMVVVFVVYHLLVKDVDGDDEEKAALRGGHEHDLTWDEIAEQRSRGKVKACIVGGFASFALWLLVPIVRRALSIQACDGNIKYYYSQGLITVLNDYGEECEELNDVFGQHFINCDCYKNISHIFLVLGCWCVTLLYVIAIPIILYVIILKHSPHGTIERLNAAQAREAGHDVPEDVEGEITFDEDGEVVEFSTALYLQAMKAQGATNPFIGLYDKYERRCSGWKIFWPYSKFILIAPGILMQPFPIAKQVVLSVLHFIIAVVFTCAGPHVDDSSNELEIIAQWSGFSCILMGCITTIAAPPWVEEHSSATHGFIVFVAVLMNIAQIITASCFIFSILRDCDRIKACLKSCTGRLDAQSMDHDTRGRHDDIVRAWNERREVKQRLWNPFWQTLIKDCSEDSAHRLIDLISKAKTFGILRVRNHWSHKGSDAQLQKWIIEELEGLDVYATADIAVPRDGHLDSSTFFGKMYVEHYPFRCLMIYDNGDDETFIHADKVHALATLNKTPKVVAMRKLREDLRGCDGLMFYDPCERNEKITEQDGEDPVMHQVNVGTKEEPVMEEQQKWHIKCKEWPAEREKYGKEWPAEREWHIKCKDLWTNTGDGERIYETKPNMHTFWTLIKYKNGRLNCSNSDWSSGFHANLRFNDGHGQYTLPRTGRHCVYTTRCWEGKGLEYGNEFTRSAIIKRILANNTSNGWRGSIAQYHQRVRAYRARLKIKARKEEAELPPMFWYKIYYDMQVSLGDCIGFFQAATNPKLSAIPRKHRESVKLLFAKIAFTQSHKACAFWFCFWHDLWESNNTVKFIRDAADLLDPTLPDALAYTPLSREDVEEKLNEAGILGPGGVWGWCAKRALCCCIQRIPMSVLDTLYAGMEAHVNGEPFVPHPLCHTRLMNSVRGKCKSIRNDKSIEGVRRSISQGLITRTT